MLEVLSAVTGESIAVFQDEEIAGASVKALKQRLAQKIGVPRFQLRLLQDNCPLDDDQTLAIQVVQLVILDFLPPDVEQDREIMVACRQNNDSLLEKHLNQPRSPNVQIKSHPCMRQPPTEVSNAYFYCLKLVPTKTNARQMMEQRLCTQQLLKGALKLSDFWLSLVPTKTKAGLTMEQHLLT